MAKIKYEYVIECLEKDLKYAKKVYRIWKKGAEKTKTPALNARYLKYWKDAISQLRSAIKLIKENESNG